MDNSDSQSNPIAVVHATDMRRRLKSLGVTQLDLARRLGVRPATISDAMTGRTARDTPRLLAEIEALEIMTAEQRAVWLERAGAA